MTGMACEAAAAVVEAVGSGDSLVDGCWAATVVGMPINESRQAAPRMAAAATLVVALVSMWEFPQLERWRVGATPVCSG